MVNFQKKLSQGLIQVYTGNGKGKTTAAVGAAIRALGQGLRVCFIQFFKPGENFSYGEQKILSKFKNLKLHYFTSDHPYFEKKISRSEIRKQCLEGLEFIKRIFKENNFDLVILDELNIALRDGFLKWEEVLSVLKSKPKNLEVIITGRGAPPGLIDYADLVTEMKPLKHPYYSDIKGRRGIEY